MPATLLTGKAPQPAPESVVRRYGVITGGLHLLLPQEVPSELLHEQAVNRILLAQPALRGVTNVRGALLPVFDLARLLAIPDSSADKILMLGKLPDALGLFVHDFPHALTGLQRCVDPVVPPLLQPYLQGAWLLDRVQWLEIDLLQLFRDLARHAAHKE
ncbi:chemotaxis protein CheW [Chitinilyticum piscinae]|uniref:Chemotaxis protein CheW n=1 Tax=Chitinilyticum piscinae TaxID=2866724 RepID=A0A8J7FJC4_9NEIS|nr:chemotaxis protein CheW [Chitinilyticum piscinae]MBE9608577.1 chemotaxis protein CheW [Chitinilyticum piscinae]